MRNYLQYLEPSWIPWTPGPLSYEDLLRVAFQTYLHFLPCPRTPKTLSLSDMNACLKYLNVSAKSEDEVLDLYATHVPGFPLLFHDDMDIAALYTSLLLTDFEKARTLTSISKEKVLAFFHVESPYVCLQQALQKKAHLPTVSDGIPYQYWLTHMNVLDKDREDLLDSLKTIQETTRLSWSYLLDRCLVQVGIDLQIGFKEASS